MLANDSDPDASDSLVVSAVEGQAANVGAAIAGSFGTLTLAADGSWSYVPNAAANALAVGETGSDSFTYEIADGHGGTATSTLSLTVTGSNDGPTAVADTATTGENTSASGNVLANDSDPDASDSLVVSAVEGQAANVGAAIAGSFGTLTLAADGSWSYVPNAAANALAVGETGSDSFTYTASDGHGGTATTTLSLTVTGANDGPVATADSAVTGENTAASGNVLANDSDPDASDTLTVAAVNGVSGNVGAAIAGSFGTLTLAADGSWSYVPNAAANALAVGETGSDSFSYTASDGHGGTATTTLSLTVTGSNDGPTAVADTATTGENTSASGNVLANDSDPDASDSLVVSAVEGQAANVGAAIAGSFGTLTLAADGSWSYVPNAAANALAVGETGSDSFSYTASDGHGGTATTTLSLTVTGSNDGPTAVADTATTGENTSASGNVLANDSDPDASDSLVVSAVEGQAANVGAAIAGSFGTLTLAADGSWSYVPNAAANALAVGETGSDSFSYTASDGHGGTATTTLSLTVTGSNDGPTAVADTATTGENTSASGNVLANDSDPDASDSLVVSAVEGQAANVGAAIAGSFGTLTLAADGSWSYVPNAAANALAVGETGSDSFSYTASDGHGGTATTTLSLTVTGSNDGPTAVADTATTGENTSASGNVLANDSDPDASDSLVVSAVEGQAANVGAAIAGSFGTLTLAADGSWSYVPNAAANALAVGETGSDSFSYTASDGHGGTATTTLSLTVTGSNDGPTAVADTATTGENTSASGNVLANDSDPDASDSLVVSAVEGQAANVGAAIAGSFGTLTLAADGSWSYVPNAAANALAVGETGSDSFSYTASDGHGGTATTTLSLTVTGSNDGPTAVADTATTGENTSASGNVLANDSDPDASDSLVVSAVEGQAANVGAAIAGSFGTLTLAADGSWSYVPNAAANALAVGETGSDSFSYTASDGHGGTATTTLSLTVTGSNDGPTAVADTATTGENTSASGNVLANDSDPDASDSLVVSAVEGQAANVGAAIAGSFGTLTLAADGSWSYVPNAAANALAVGETGSDSFSYTASDGHGGTATTTLSLTVTGSNDGPTAVADTATTGENTSASGNVLANDSDPDASDSLVVSAVEGQAANVGAAIAGSFGTLTLAADGSWSYVPNAAANALAVGETGSDSFSYTASDGHGGTATTTLSLTVTGSNDGPTAVADTATTGENTSASGNVLANDSDPDASDSLVVSAVEGQAANVGAAIAGSFGTLTLAADGSWSYVPNAAANALAVGETGSDSFSYTASDGHGGTATTTLSLTVTGSNDGPTAVADTATTGENTSASGNVLANDSDPDASDSLVVSAVEGQAANVGAAIAGSFGTLTLAADGSWSYVPNAAANALAVGETGSDSFSYTASDGHGGTATTTLSLTVTGSNDGPTAVADTATTGENTSASGNVLANDSDPDASDSLVVSAVEGQAANVGAAIAGSFGTLTLAADGSWSYVPNAAANALAVGETGSDSFSYTASDGHGGTATTTLSLTVTGSNDGPTAVADTATTGENTSASGNVLANDSDPDASDSLVVSAVEGQAANVGAAIAGSFGTLTLAADGSWSYVPNAAANALAVGETGSDSFSYTASDGHGGTATTTLSLTVTGSNDGPTAVADTATTGENTSASGNVLANDSDPDASDSLVVSAVEGQAANVGAAIAGSFGTLTLAADGSWSYVPNAAANALAVGETGSDSFSYTASDGHGGTATTTLSLTVTGSNDGPTAVADTATTGENTSASGNVLANDSDPDASDSLVVSAVEGQAANVGAAIAGSFGTLTLAADGSWSYVPNAAANALAVGETGSDSFSYTASDGHGGTATTTLSLTVTGSNDGPTAVADTATTGENTSASGNVLANDSDPDASDSLVVSAVEGQAANVGAAIAGSFGTLTLAADGSWSYVPNAAANALAVGETGSDSFSYTASDGHGGTATTTLSLTVTGSNDGPTANPDTATTGEDTNASGNVRTNDTDPDLTNVLTVSAVEGLAGNVGNAVAGAYGALTLNSNGSWTFVPNIASNRLALGQTVTNTFNYTIRDPAGATSSSTLTINVNGTNDAPTALSLTNSSVIENMSVGTVVGYATPVDSDTNDTFTYSLVGAATPFAINAASGVITVNGALNFEGTASYNITVRVTDAGGLFFNQAATISVLNATEGSAAGETISGTAGNDIIFGLGGNDTITGANGNDTIFGGAGGDNMNGGGGTDTLSYVTATGAVNVNLQSGAVSGNDAAGDTIAAFENLTGSNFNDTLTGSTGANVITGLDGVDTIDGGSGNDTIEGGAGADILNGNTGTDTLSYASSTGAVNVNLATSAVSGGHAAGDTITAGSFENVLGSNLNDVLVGSSGVNNLSGAGGDDSLRGGLGNDALLGGAGHDLFTYQIGDGVDTVNGGAGASWIDAIRILDALGGSNSVYGVDWTLSLSSGTILNTNVLTGTMELSSDADGTISFSAGGSMTLTDVERITW